MKQYLRVDQLATRLAVHPVTANRWRVKGQGPKYVKRDGLIYYALSDVIAWEKEQVKFQKLTPKERKYKHISEAYRRLLRARANETDTPDHPSLYGL